MKHDFKQGDVVASNDPAYPLRSGAFEYAAAVVVSAQPLVLVSQAADMRWESTVLPDKLRKIGDATPYTLNRCLGRL